jgi:AcrR family transcriptional regulator
LTSDELLYSSLVSINRRRESSTVKPQVKTRPDDTRARIMETAEALFRRLGFAKTAVADIAAELKMSPANVYRFFASKNAIVEAICRRCLSEVEEKAWAAARAKAPAGQRIERLVLEILAYHKENLLASRQRDGPVCHGAHVGHHSRPQGDPSQCHGSDPA